MRTPDHFRDSPHVLLIFGRRYNPAIHRGVARHAGRSRWHLSMLMHTDEKPLTGLKQVRGVIIADRFSHVVIDSLLASGLPLVNLSADPMSFSGARVTGDNRAIGRLAAAYLLERRYPSFAYYGEVSSVASRFRRTGFEETLAGRGHSCLRIENRPDGAKSVLDWAAEMRDIHLQLDVSSVPVAVFCFNDFYAARFLDAVLQLGRHVPEEIAILGVDDDPLICENVSVPLSSIRHPLEELGTRGAELLGELFSGQAARSTHLLLPPAGVSTRRSTDYFAVRHPTLQAILLHIERNHESAISLTGVASAVGMSPRTVQQLLRTHLGTTVAEEVLKRRLARAQRLLTDPEHLITDIAATVGFSSASYFHHAFKRATGQTPLQYRRHGLATRAGKAC